MSGPVAAAMDPGRNDSTATEALALSARISEVSISCHGRVLPGHGNHWSIGTVPLFRHACAHWRREQPMFAPAHVQHGAPKPQQEQCAEADCYRTCNVLRRVPQHIGADTI